MTAQSSLIRRIVSSSCMLVALTAYSAAQGADNCGAAQSITGLGTFAFDNTSATPDGPPDCNGIMIRKDLWWAWTAPATGGFRATTCGSTTLSTRIAVYDGTNCSALNQIDCNTGVCVNQSFVQFPAVAGQTYLIRLGSKQVGVGGSGSFAIEVDVCITAGDDAFEDNDTCATALSLMDGTYPGLHVKKTDPDWYSLTVPSGGSLLIDVFFTTATGDIDIFLFDACGGTQVTSSASGSDDEQILWDNLTACPQTYKLRVEHWLPDSQAECNDYSMAILGTGTGGPTCGIGTNYCVANPNSTGSPALMTATGSASIAANNLGIQASTVPAQPGIFFYANNQAQIPFGNGFLCATGTISRFPVVVGSAGVASYAIDYGSVPVTGPIISGSDWNFQFWYRDPAAGGAFFNTSDGLNIVFTP